MSGRKRLTNEEVIHRLLQKYPNLTLLEEYKNSRSDIKVFCEIHDYTWTSKYNRLIKNGCPVCSGSRMTLKILEEKLKSVNEDLEIISNEYNGYHSYIRVKCNIDGHEWSARPSNLLNGNGCPECKRRKMTGSKYTIEDIINEVHEINPKIEIMETEFVGIRHKMNSKCTECGHIWKINLNNIRVGHGCPECSRVKRGNEKRLSLEYIVNKLNSIDNNIRILSDEYVSAKTPLLLQCKKCECEWSATWDSLNHGSGCPICNGGFYSLERAERHKYEWMQIECTVYLIRCYTDDEEFYKIGITSGEVEDRFKKSNMPYKIEIVDKIVSNKYESVLREADLLKIGRSRKYDYPPNIKFSGHTECFDFNIVALYRELERRIYG